VLLAIIFFTQTARAAEQDNYQVTALFLYNFANFVEWPDRAFKSTSAPLRMCLFGNVPFGRMLKPFDGAVIGDRELNILTTRKIKNIESGCHILFVGEDQRAHLSDFFKQIQYMYVLSVGKQVDFINKGGIISIVNTAQQMRFDINLTMASANRLTISSDLLSLAREIKRLEKN
jgi:hypothetical protein